MQKHKGNSMYEVKSILRQKNANMVNCKKLILENLGGFVPTTTNNSDWYRSSNRILFGGFAPKPPTAFLSHGSHLQCREKQEFDESIYKHTCMTEVIVNATHSA